MKKSIQQKLEKSKWNLSKRLDPEKRWEEQDQPMFRGANIAYEMADRAKAIDCGGLGAIHAMVLKLGLAKAIDRNLHLLKRHLPYHESDHILNMVFNLLTGGTCLEDLELRRNNENYMDALGAQRIPDPTTEGDFLRRFKTAERVLVLMETINDVRVLLWKMRPRRKRRNAVVDVDGLVAATDGECKQGMDISYKGEWGYHPLVITLANTGEHLYIVNRSGNVPSHDGAVEWMDRAIALVRKGWSGVCLRGDTDFSLTKSFDRWDGDKVKFVFGMNAYKNLIEMAESLGKQAWKQLTRPAKYEVKTAPRRRPANVKERIVEERGYENIRLLGEEVAEFDYQPWACDRPYRVVVVRKQLEGVKGQTTMWEEYRYFFYITNRQDLSMEEIVYFANDRCRHENEIEQLKNGVHAMKLPAGDLVSNWAYMVIASLAWNLKAWYAQLMPDRKAGERVLRMEFKTFLNALIRIPCQIVRTGRRRVYRFLGYTPWLEDFFETWDVIRGLRVT